MHILHLRLKFYKSRQNFKFKIPKSYGTAWNILSQGAHWQNTKTVPILVNWKGDITNFFKVIFF